MRDRFLCPQGLLSLLDVSPRGFALLSGHEILLLEAGWIACRKRLLRLLLDRGGLGIVIVIVSFTLGLRWVLEPAPIGVYLGLGSVL